MLDKDTLKDRVLTPKLANFEPNDQMSFQYLKKFSLFEFARREHHQERHFVNNNESLAHLGTHDLRLLSIGERSPNQFIK